MHAKDNSTIILDREQLREITLDDPDLMREIIAMLIDDTSSQLRRLDSAIRGRDATECLRLAHYSKGACANVGANAAAALFKRIEGNASAGNFDGCANEFAAIANQIERLREEAEQI